VKLSFSTNGWHSVTFDSFLSFAKDLSFQGIEIYNVRGSLFTKTDSAFSEINTATTLRRMRESSLTFSCMDAVSDIADPAQTEDAIKEICDSLEICSLFRIPYLRLRAKNCEDREAGETVVRELLTRVIPEAEKRKVVLLIETTGLFVSSLHLRNLLEYFADDSLAAVWNLTDSFFGSCEKPDEVIRNLGAYVRHVHVNDAVVRKGGEREYCLIGEGELPISDIMQALRSVNYDGFLSIVWTPKTHPYLNDMEVIYSQFRSYMRRFGELNARERTFYYNRTHTGRFIWKKEAIINATFSGVLDRMADAFPDQYAFKFTTLDYTRTYSEFRDDVDTFARSLLAMGVRPGSHVAVWASNVPQWYIAFWATVKIGAVLVTVNTAYKIHELEYLLKQSDTHTLIMTEGSRDISYGDIVLELCPELRARGKEPLHAHRLPFLRNVVTVGYRIPGAMDWREAWALAEKVPVSEVHRLAALVKPNDVCNMQYTSGTTGFPKGVMLTHHNIVNNGKCIGDRMDLSTADRMMIHVPMFHCFGMVLAMTATMTHGGTLYPLPYFNAKSSLACIDREKITCFHGVPTMFISMLEHPDFPKTDFSCMRTGIMAGSPCPISAMKDVVEKMHMTEITIVYGQTEASPGCTMSSTDDSIEVRVSTVGRPLPEIECKIVNPETGEECPVDVPGEFLARGYNIMKGYYKMPRETAEAIDAEGWLHTGDLAAKTAEGNFRITGRLKDMIIRGGENVYPKEIEEFIYTNPKVSDVQVIGVPDIQYGEEIMACIILKEGETCTEEEMKAFIAASMARHKVPKYIDFVSEFPMNAAGKILKYKMREEAVKKLGLQKAASVETA